MALRGVLRPSLEACPGEANTAGFTKPPRIHDLRHTHTSWLIAGKVPPPVIQARLGHESITTTVDRYGHLLESSDDGIVAAGRLGDECRDATSPHHGCLRHIRTA